MKTNTKMNLLKSFAAAVAITLLSTGCIVLSVYPFYTPQDLVSDPGLAGRWNNNAKTNEFWQFAAPEGDAAGKSCLLTVMDGEETNGFEAHLFQLKQYRFLDVLTTNRSMYSLPMHLIAKASRNDASLSLHFLDYGWLSGLLETNPAVLRHIVVPEHADDPNSDKMVYLTADTKDLQKFLLKHADDANAFNTNSEVELSRVSQ
jgi:hypothetical protein